MDLSDKPSDNAKPATENVIVYPNNEAGPSTAVNDTYGPDGWPSNHTVISEPFDSTQWTMDVYRPPVDWSSTVPSVLAAIPGTVGLSNLGNTCFMNAGIQCLFSNTKLVDYFINIYPHENVPLLPNNSLTSCFVTLLKQVWSTNRVDSVVKPVEFKEALGQIYPQFRDYRQHDCQEFLALLLGTLHDQLNIAIYGNTNPCDSLNFQAPCYSDKLSDHNDQLPNEGMDTAMLTSVQTTSLCPDSCVGSVTTSPKSTDSSSSSVSSTDNYVDRNQPLPDNVKSFDIQADSSNIIPVEKLTGRTSQSPICKRLPEKNELYQLASGLVKPISGDEPQSKSLTVADLEKSTKISNTNVLCEQKKSNNEINFNSNKFPKSRDRNQASELVDNFRNPFACLEHDADIGEDCLGEEKLAVRKRLKVANVINDGNVETETDDVEVNMSDNIGECTKQKRLKVESIDSGVDKSSMASSARETVDTLCDDEGAHEWHSYLSQNKSVIVDTFQGQFKSSVTCSTCDHVSVTFEPFMYLPVPLPNALEKQLIVTFVSSPVGASYGCRCAPPVKYMINVHKHDRLMKVINTMKEMLKEEDVTLSQSYLQLAEVKDNCILKLLDPTSCVRNMEYDCSLYIFEIPNLQTDPDHMSNSPQLGRTYSSGHIDTSPTNMDYDYSPPQKDYSDATCVPNVSPINNSPMRDDGFESDGSPMKPASPNVSPINVSPIKDDSNDDKFIIPALKAFETDIKPSIFEWNTDASYGVHGPQLPTFEKCCVCLEEKSEEELVKHPDPCSCIICTSCLDSHVKHNASESGGFPCPICSNPVKKIDYVAYTAKDDIYRQPQ